MAIRFKKPNNPPRHKINTEGKTLSEIRAEAGRLGAQAQQKIYYRMPVGTRSYAFVRRKDNVIVSYMDVPPQYQSRNCEEALKGDY